MVHVRPTKGDYMTRFAWVVLAILAIAAIPAAARADTITLTDWTSGNFAANAAGGGGAFLATTTGTGPLGNSAFMTFCIEYNENFSYGGTYNFELSGGAVAGGVSGGNPDPVSDATMWLYYQALSGGYSTWWTAIDLNLGATFQYAIWFLEGELLPDQINDINMAGYQMAQYAQDHQNWGTLFAQGHRVYAMNLTSASGPAQDQLAYIAPVPEHGSLLLFVTGLAGVGGLRRTWRTRRG
jgi:hypothetical protein